jgi:hypothetical protein
LPESRTRRDGLTLLRQGRGYGRLAKRKATVIGGEITRRQHLQARRPQALADTLQYQAVLEYPATEHDGIQRMLQAERPRRLRNGPRQSLVETGRYRCG